ncbi:hypothetical protein [Rhodopirellula sp. MGV]|uniref:hypothetical protein n=1 Tax=Rhodopirellula sp. MGV TaxID=2023130 RepID=UPI000B979BBD|nr:hypothetical protein [Rhodopirellula sp. MGV]OYP38064.1 hypothetical protein CGZ80_03475 [Rhodopirellula sp. MGV]
MNPEGMLDMVQQLPQVNEDVRGEFADVVKETYRRSILQQAQNLAPANAPTAAAVEAVDAAASPSHPASASSASASSAAAPSVTDGGWSTRR